MSVSSESSSPAGTAGAGAPLLSLRNIDKSFGAVHVLRSVDLDVYAGQVTALVGDNGAGKSTLIKGVAGIYSFDSGEYLFEGQSVGLGLNLLRLVVQQQRAVAVEDLEAVPFGRVMAGGEHEAVG